jgi:hypothetical protein
MGRLRASHALGFIAKKGRWGRAEGSRRAQWQKKRTAVGQFNSRALKIIKNASGIQRRHHHMLALGALASYNENLEKVFDQ